MPCISNQKITCDWGPFVCLHSTVRAHILRNNLYLPNDVKVHTFLNINCFFSSLHFFFNFCYTNCIFDIFVYHSIRVHLLQRHQMHFFIELGFVVVVALSVWWPIRVYFYLCCLLEHGTWATDELFTHRNLHTKHSRNCIYACIRNR